MIRKAAILLSIFTIPVVLIAFSQIVNRESTDLYRAVQWTMEDGLPQSGNHSVIKDVKGFLWIGSSMPGFGFSRFDGITFKKYLPETDNRNTINSDNIISFTEDSLDNIWIGTDKGLSRYDVRADTFASFLSDIAPKSADKSSIPFWSTKNKLYCVESGLHVVTYDIGSFQKKVILSLKETDRIQKKYIILDIVTQSLWLLHYENGSGLLNIDLRNGKRQYYSWPCYRHVPNHDHGSEAMQYDRKRNSIWINSPDGLMEFSMSDKQFHPVDAFRDLIKLKDYSRFVGIDIDKEGRVWLATYPKGILIYSPETQRLRQVFSDQDPQIKSGDANLQVYCDREGIVWASNWGSFGMYEILPFDRSVKRYHPKPGTRDSLSNGFVITITKAPQNKVWIGTFDGINIFDPITEKFEVLRETDLPGIIGKAIAPIYIDTVRQKAWLYAGPADPVQFYTLSHIYEMDLKSRQCRQIIFRDRAKVIDEISIEPGQARLYKNGLLICTDSYGVFEIKEDSLFADMIAPLHTNYLTSGMYLEGEQRIFLKLYGALPNYSFENRGDKWASISHMLDSLDWWFIVEDKKDQTHWASFKYKLVHYDKGFNEIKTYGEADGYKGMAYKMTFDNQGNLWFVDILEQVGRLDVNTGIITMLSETDGYFKKNYDWAVPLANDVYGNIYFGTGLSKGNQGLDCIFPARFFSAKTSSVYLQALSVNQKPFQQAIGINNIDELSLRYNENTITIETGIIDFYAKGKSNFRYRLMRNGKEEQWQYSTAYYNTIRYDGLVPGHYKLVMQSSNADNEFNSPEKNLVFVIHPPFWETWWFRVSAIAMLLLIFYGIYRLRTATLRRQKKILEQTVKERTAEVVREKAEIQRQKEVIQSEKDKSDGLLLNILPSEVAAELKEKGYTTAKAFEEVTVLFSDIKGFTHVAEKLTPQELVKEIDIYFSAFDKIMQEYGLEKIKTIGDAYIAAGGLPEKNQAVAADGVLAAIAMQRVVEELKAQRVENDKPFFELRIGIHTGPVVAGVVGIKKFQYDIWGDTVNLAARMEQSGEPGRINISQYTYELVKDKFTCIARGKIEAKNKGEINMYFVNGLRDV